MDHVHCTGAVFPGISSLWVIFMEQFAQYLAQKFPNRRPVSGPGAAAGILDDAERAFFLTRDRAEIGRWAEELAVDFLDRQGVKIVERNVRERFSEIDIVGMVRDELVFVEVRCRRKNKMMSALETLGVQKWKRLVRGAELYVQKMKWTSDWRIDLIAIDVDHVEWRLKWYRYLEMGVDGPYGG